MGFEVLKQDQNATIPNPPNRKQLASEARPRHQKGYFDQRNHSALNDSAIPVKKKSDRPFETNKIYSKQNLSFAYMHKNARTTCNQSPQNLALRVKSEMRHYNTSQERKPRQAIS